MNKVYWFPFKEPIFLHCGTLEMNNTLIKGIKIIEMLCHSDKPLRLTDIANELDLVKSNVHRLLHALVEQNYVIKDEKTGEYNASIKLWELGSAVLSKLDLRKHSEKWMDSLTQLTSESVHLSIIDNMQVVYVHKIDSPNPIRAYTQIGGRVPLFCVATGKIMLAYQSDVFIERVAKSLEAFTPNTITNPKKLFAEVEKIRKQGYAVNKGEWREGVYGVATPISDGSGNVIAAIGLSGPANRFKPQKIKEFAQLLTQASSAITFALGGGNGHLNLQRITHLW